MKLLTTPTAFDISTTLLTINVTIAATATTATVDVHVEGFYAEA